MNARISLTLVAIIAGTLVVGCQKVETSDTTNDDMPSTSETKPEAEATAIYSVATYDPAADPAADLAATVAQAQKDGRRIILEIGGQW